MTGSALAKSWALALVLVAGIVLSLERVEGQIDREAMGRPVVVIGSSLMLYAVPATFSEPAGLLGDGRGHARFSVQQITEEQILALVSQALDAGARTIFVEANSLTFDFAHRRLPWVLRYAKALTERSYELRRPIKWLLGYNVFASQDEPPVLDSDPVIKPEDLAAAYPLFLREPEHPLRLSKIAEEARRKGVEIVLIVPPRSETAANYMGKEAQEALQAHFEALVRKWGFSLFRTSPFWPDDYFLDHAHMNARGRARFLTEIAAWWRDR